MEEDRTLMKIMIDFLGDKQGNERIDALSWCIFELADQIDKINNIKIKKEYEWEKVTVQEKKFMLRFGWEFYGDTSPAIKRDLTTGKVLAHEGDETWTRDLKVAGE